MDIQLIPEYAVIAVAIVYFIIKLIYKIKVNGLSSTVRELILEAETKFKEGENSEKMNYCIEQLIAKLPTPLQKLASYINIKDFIQGIFDTIKSAMDYNKTTTDTTEAISTTLVEGSGNVETK